METGMTNESVFAWLVAALLLCGCNLSDAPTETTSPAVREVICGECDGDGVVSYPEGHVMVELHQAEPDKKYRCPMCGGGGTLYEDI